MGGQNTWRGKQPAEFKLVPGIYRISVLDSSVTPNQKQEIRDIEIVSGQTVEKTSDCGENGCVLKKETGRNILEDVNIKLLPG
jgi:Ca-activated chloride channel family protein